MMKDIETREDLETLLTEFYSVAVYDAEIGHHFADLNLETHLPIIVDFWENVLFGKQIYFNNPMLIHQALDKISPLKPEHFSRWIEIFTATVEEFFAGETAEKAKFRAETIGRSLNQKINDVDFSKSDKKRFPIL